MSQISLNLERAPSSNPDVLIYFTAVIPPLAGEFLYAYSPTTIAQVSVGDVVKVSLGRRETYAFITSHDSVKEHAAKDEMISRGKVVKEIPSDAVIAHAFNQEHLAFYEWIARYYAEPLSKILDLAVPTPASERLKVGYRIILATPNTLATPNALSTPNAQSALDESAVKLKEGSIQRAIFSLLSTTSEPLDITTLKERCGASPAALRALVKKGLIEQITITEADNDTAAMLDSIEPPILNSEQTLAVQKIREHAGMFHTTLLHGVTGSGKTEVYLTLIIEALSQGKSALVMVPEIALTPQLTERFVSRLRQPVAVLHSSLKPKERWRHWADLAAGRVRVAIGARSAIFAPLKDIGIIVVDEEHDSSFKQGDGIRYHARDLALVRAKLASCPVILGSATPSLETFHNAISGRYTHVHLTQRYYDAAPSQFRIIDLNKIKPWEMKSKNISPTFFSMLHHTLEKGGQSFVLYNKRGFASYLQCSACENVLGCPHCSVTLTYHRNTHSLLCHQCNFSMVPPGVCIGCGANEGIGEREEPLFAHRGSGTERVHEEISGLFPKARVAILDRDTVSSITDYIEILGRVKAREIDILVGTQMIAKGHDLPGVTFVGIVDCDVGLHIPDFRASERAFQLLTQVAGRAGRRSEQGQVALQTRVPQHPSLCMTAAANYNEFAKQELTLRSALGYPPFFKLLRIIISTADRSAALQYAASIAQAARPYTAERGMSILGPAPAPIEKIRTLWRYHVLIKSPSASELQHLMKQIKKLYPSSQQVRIAYDLDPHDML